MSPGGRPEIGQPINVRLGDELLAAVDAKAHRLGYSRAEVIRLILSDALACEMSAGRPYASG
jgi:metal-responsive CopG/Arc/MetJ family transcriptional regulator